MAKRPHRNLWVVSLRLSRRRELVLGLRRDGSGPRLRLRSYHLPAPGRASLSHVLTLYL